MSLWASMMAAWSLLRLQPAAPAPVQPAPPAAPPVMRFAAHGLPEAITRQRPTVTPWKLPAPPPGVLPDDAHGMAQDSDLGNIYAYAANNGIWGEGLQWLGYPYLSELAQRPEYRRISETIAKEMTRRWIKLQASGEDDKTDKLRALEAAMKKYRVQDVFRRAAELDGFFGRAQIYLDTGDTDDKDELRTPLRRTPAKIRKGALRALTVVEPMWSYPNAYNSTDPLRRDYFKPRSWFVQGRQVHASRLLTFISREVPDLLKPAYAFGGISLSQLAQPYVENWLRTRQSVSDLIHTFSVGGVMTNMASTMQQLGEEGLFKRAAFYNLMRDNRGLMLLDKDTEEYFNVATPLGTLDHLQAQAQEQMASVSGIPLVVLLGITPSGLNASSDGELRAFYAWIESQQEQLFGRQLTRVLEVIQLSEFGAIDPELTFTFEPLWQLDDAGKAGVRKTDADTAAVYIQAGVLRPEEERARLAADEDSIYAALDLEDSEAPGPPADPAAEGDPANDDDDPAGRPDMPHQPGPGRAASERPTGPGRQAPPQRAMERPAAPGRPEMGRAMAGDANNPDEPRDGTGKWTTGGGSTPPGSSVSAGRAKPATLYTDKSPAYAGGVPVYLNPSIAQVAKAMHASPYKFIRVVIIDGNLAINEGEGSDHTEITKTLMKHGLATAEHVKTSMDSRVARRQSYFIQALGPHYQGEVPAGATRRLGDRQVIVTSQRRKPLIDKNVPPELKKLLPPTIAGDGFFDSVFPVAQDGAHFELTHQRKPERGHFAGKQPDTAEDAFNEGDHPRGADGKFGSTSFYHGTADKNFSLRDGNLRNGHLFLTPHKQVADAYANQQVFKVKDADSDPLPQVHEFRPNMSDDEVLDPQREEHVKILHDIIDQINKEEENDPDWQIPKRHAVPHGERPGINFGFLSQLRPRLAERGFKAAIANEGSQGWSLNVFNPKDDLTHIKPQATAEDAETFDPSKHPRGQPENAGEFAASPAAGPAANPALSVAPHAPANPAMSPAKAAMKAAISNGKTRTQADGSPLPAHIEALKIPPAWTDVRYNDAPGAALLAVGKDAKGRPQSVYSAAHSAAAAAAKFARIHELAAKFAEVTAQNDAARQDPKTRDVADCMNLVMKMGVRPGSDDDTGAKVKAYGATTLEGKHVVVGSDGSVSLQFVGKKGVSLNLPVTDPSLASNLKERAAAAGADGKLFNNVTDKGLLDHSHSLDGGSFKVKDFRTHLGTKTAGELVRTLPKPANAVQYKKAVMQVAKTVSERLGNTPTIALESYISPVTFALWREHAGL